MCSGKSAHPRKDNFHKEEAEMLGSGPETARPYVGMKMAKLVAKQAS